MKLLLLIALLAGFVPISYAQESAVQVERRLVIEAPEGYVNTYSTVEWSPDSTLVAMRFNILNETSHPVQGLWQVYDIESGNMTNEFDVLLAWYADSSRLLIQSGDSPPMVVDAQTGASLFTLDEASHTFPNTLIEDAIVNLDDNGRLRVRCTPLSRQ